ncbi:hypothetical protein TSOC_011296 [Tetrabaena socialis]|uniref:Uncharacterized protein n=1 Tax=Tetrabaena socialis TaxID=47790 RepID=A0A2J7ZR04_9CHLO|nr:hypothetical protein TSOC_011296 [Tetrabaena socialis]|eukprot:PNH02701.1 hypothetical protein TSOC_011296 [Tetrabaena socialis]
MGREPRVAHTFVSGTATAGAGATTPEGRRCPPDNPRFVKDPAGYTWCERSDIDPETLAGFKELLRVNDAVFARSLKEIGCYDGPIGPATIELLHDDPIFEAPRRHSPREKAIQQEKCSELRDAGIIVPSTSGRYALNSTMPAKKDAEGNWTDARYCCDARPLNNATR